MTRALSLIGMALLAGCYSMDVATTDSLQKSAISSDEGGPMEHVVVSNYGWYLLNWLPVVCGNATPGASFPWKFFSNHVSAEILHDRLMAHAEAKDANVKDLAFFRDEKVIFTIPGTNFPIPIPYVLCYREIQFSGTLTQRATPAMREDAKKKKALDEMNQLLNRLNPEGER
jgi:hypothetical protein